MDLKLRFALSFSAILSLFLVAFCWIVFTQVKHQTILGVNQSLSQHVEHELRHLSFYKQQEHSHENTLTSKDIYQRMWRDMVLIQDTFPKGEPPLNPEMPLPKSEDKIFQYEKREIDGSRVDLIAYHDLNSVKKHLATVAKVLWLGCVVGFLIILPLSWFIARLFLTPFRNLAKVTRELDAKQLSFRFPIPNRNDEFGTLAQSFNLLLERLEKSFHGLRKFATNASHELRTPLTVIQGEADIGLRRKRTTEEYEAILNTIRTHSERLQRVTSRLLLFADVERMEQETTKTPIHIRDFLTQLIEDLHRLHPEFQRHIDIQGELIIFNFQHELFASILTNLVENAIKYAKNRVLISYQQNMNRLEFRIADDGEGIPEEYLTHVYEPFFTHQKLKRIKGHGLGLSIVKACVEAADGELRLSRSPELGGLEAFVSFPM